MDPLPEPSSVLSPMVAQAAAAAQKAAAAYLASQSPDVTPETTADIAFPDGSTPTKQPPSFVIPKNKFAISNIPQPQPVAPPLSSIPSQSAPEITGMSDFGSFQVPSETAFRKTGWGPNLLSDPSVNRGRILALQTRAEQIAQQLETGQLDLNANEGCRSPSPPPVYGENGQRVNTRESRRREMLDIERREAIGECMQLNPGFKPPAGFKPVLKEAKFYLPVKQHPGYNFIGLILGPRGNTQKRMEQETGAKIVIRGKGAVKEGKGKGKDGKYAEGANEDLHVYICADTIEKVDAAVSLIEPLLTPVDETRNNHKRKQLAELAKMNGTIRDIFCRSCGEAGHCDWQCPNTKLQTFQANVTCAHCGDGGHPTSDCPVKASGGASQGNLDNEYKKLLEELGGKPAGSESAPDSNPTSTPTPAPVPLPLTPRPPLNPNFYPRPPQSLPPWVTPQYPRPPYPHPMGVPPLGLYPYYPPGAPQVYPTDQTLQPSWQSSYPLAPPGSNPSPPPPGFAQPPPPGYSYPPQGVYQTPVAPPYGQYSQQLGEGANQGLLHGQGGQPMVQTQWGLGEGGSHGFNPGFGHSVAHGYHQTQGGGPGYAQYPGQGQGQSQGQGQVNSADAEYEKLMESVGVL